MLREACRTQAGYGWAKHMRFSTPERTAATSGSLGVSSAHPSQRTTAFFIHASPSTGRTTSQRQAATISYRMIELQSHRNSNDTQGEISLWSCIYRKKRLPLRAQHAFRNDCNPLQVGVFLFIPPRGSPSAWKSTRLCVVSPLCASPSGRLTPPSVSSFSL